MWQLNGCVVDGQPSVTWRISPTCISCIPASKGVGNVVRKESNDGDVCGVAFMSRGGNDGNVDVSSVGLMSAVDVAVAVVAGCNGNGVVGCWSCC